MSSRNTLKHTVSTTTPPTNGTLGDEWFNPASNRLYKLVANQNYNGVELDFTNIFYVDDYFILKDLIFMYQLPSDNSADKQNPLR